ncbi:MAG TPA: hypothetical protein VKV95_19445 [Terriglobia bacterium]|nr:hypothetical protein [Terriglobia bacterium]
MTFKTISLQLGLILSLTSSLGAAQSLADIARATREDQNKGGKKPAKIFTNEDLPEHKTKSGQSSDAPPTSTGPDTPSVPTPANYIFTVESRSGNKIDVAPDAKTDLVFMGTWCQYSKQLKDVLNDPRSHPYWADRKLIFLFSNNEWARANSRLEKMARNGDFPEAEIPAKLEELKKEAGSPYVIDPSFLDNLPGDAYFVSVPTEVQTAGWPTILSTKGYVDRGEWLVRQLKMPVDEFKKVSGDHDPDKDDASNQK